VMMYYDAYIAVLAFFTYIFYCSCFIYLFLSTFQFLH